MVFTSPAVIGKDIGEELGLNTAIRGRILLKNIGDTSITLHSASITSTSGGGFYILGQQNGNVPIIKSNPEYRVQLPNSPELTVGSIDLNNKNIKIRKNFTPGLEGGYMFDLLDSPGGTFIQKNNGVIQNIVTRDKLETDYFINDLFIRNNSDTNILPGASEAYIEVVFQGLDSSNLNHGIIYEILDPAEQGLIQYTDENGIAIANILGSKSSQYYTADLTITSSSKYSPQVGEIKVYVNIE